MRQRSLIAVLVVLAAVAGLVLIRLSGRVQDREEAEVRQCVREVLPYVEQAAGKKLKHIPELKVGSRKEIEAVLAEEFARDYESSRLHLSPGEIRRRSSYWAKQFARAAAGLYLRSTKKLVVLPQNILALMQKTHVGKEHYHAVLKLIVAHELTHALQGQEGIQKRYDHLTTAQEKQVIGSMLIEGYAEFTTGRVAEAMHIPEVKAMLDTMQKNSLAIDQRYGGQAAISRRIVEEQLMLAQRFFSWHYANGGSPRLWQVMANPPASALMFYHPETYSPKAQSSVDRSSVLKGMENRFGSGPWNVITYGLDVIGLTAAAKEVMPDRADQLMTGIIDEPYLAAQSGRATVVIRLYVMKSKAYAPLVAAFSRKGFRKQFVPTDKSIPVTGPVESDIRIPGFDYVGRETLVVGTGSQRSWKRHYEFTRDNDMVMVFAEGVRLTDQQAASIAREVLTRLKGIESR